MHAELKNDGWRPAAHGGYILFYTTLSTSAPRSMSSAQLPKTSQPMDVDAGPTVPSHIPSDPMAANMYPPDESPLPHAPCNGGTARISEQICSEPAALEGQWSSPPADQANPAGSGEASSSGQRSPKAAAFGKSRDHPSRFSAALPASQIGPERMQSTESRGGADASRPAALESPPAAAAAAGCKSQRGASGNCHELKIILK